uniref:BTB domain-containing protein n=1 Tax=Ciona savignyi TaxID=51511 RepID=H2YZB5_CIOSA
MLRLNDLRLRSLLCDVIFKVDNETFHAHKAVMASCSEFCRKKFLSCSENAPDQEIYTLEIHNLSSLGFRLLLDFIYTGELDVNDVTAQHITQAAIVMEMREIADMVAKRVGSLEIAPQAKTTAG